MCDVCHFCRFCVITHYHANLRVLVKMVAELAWSRRRNKPHCVQASLENIHRYNETRTDELRHSSMMAALTQLLHSSLTSQASTVQISTSEVGRKLRKPTMLEKAGGNYEDFAFKYKAHVWQQDSSWRRSRSPTSTSAAQFPHT